MAKMEVDATPDLFEDAITQTQDIFRYSNQSNTQTTNVVPPHRENHLSTNYFVLPYSTPRTSPEFATFFREAQTVTSILNIQPYSAAAVIPETELMNTQESMFPLSLPSFAKDTLTYCQDTSQTQLTQIPHHSSQQQQQFSQKTKTSPLYSQTDKDGLHVFSGNLIDDLPDEKFSDFEEAIKALPGMCREIYDSVVKEHTRPEDDPDWRANQDILIELLRNFNTE